MRAAGFLALTLLACSSVPAPLPSDFGELEHTWIRALIRSDRPVISRLAAEDFVTEFLDNDAPSDNRVPSWVLGVAASPGSGVYDERSIEIGPLTVVVDGDEASVKTTLTYKPHVSLRMGENRYGAQRTWNVEDRWQRRSGRWQVVKRISSLTS
jgi:hypothetical protein